MLSNPLKSETSPSHSSTANKYLQDNNQRALELLMRIQSQLEATTVIATAPKLESVYE